MFSKDAMVDGRTLNSVTQDFAGRQGFVSGFGEVVTGQRRDDISLNFVYSNSAKDVTDTSAGTGSIGHTGALAEVRSGAGVGEGRLESVDSTRYRAGHHFDCMFTTLYESNEDGVNSRHGLYDERDGFAFGFQGTQFGIWYKNNTVEIFIPQTSWNRKKLDGTEIEIGGFDLDPSTLNIYYISYAHLGVFPPYFQVYLGDVLGWQTVHVIETTNSLTVTTVDNPNLPVSMAVERASGTGVDVVLRSGSWRAGAIGEDQEDNSSDRWFNFTVLEVSLVSSARNNVFTLRSKDLFQGKNNHVRAEISVVSFSNEDSAKTVAFFGTTGGILDGNGAFTDINSADSVMQVSTGGTVSGGAQGPATVQSAKTDRRSDVRGTGIFIYPGEDFTVEAETPAGFNGTVSVSFRWVEGF